MVKEKSGQAPQGRPSFFLLAAAGLVLLAAAAALRWVPFDNDISVMLPAEKEILRSFQFFREAPFTANVAVSFERDPNSRTLPDLLRAVDSFCANIHLPEITRVTAGVDSGSAGEGMREFLRLAPQLSGAQELQSLEAKSSDASVHSRLEALYRQSLSPAGSFMLPMMTLDPLGFHEKALKDLHGLLSGFDYEVHLEEGHLVSRDGLHALVVLETQVPVTDGAGARKLMETLQKLLTDLPPGISAEIVAGHRHTVSNEKIIKRDIWVTASVTSLFFILLFFFIFKDGRALLLFAVPAVSVLLAVPVCAFVMGRLSYIIMGMGAVISGIAVDYCIHVYVAMQSVKNKKEAIREIVKPIAGGALTTVGVFAVFLFSEVPGNRQLALLTILSLFFSLGIALFIFPLFLRRPAVEFSRRGVPLRARFPDAWTVGIWAAVIIVCAAAVPSVHFRMDVRQYDGSERSIIAGEEKFRKDWAGGERPAMLVIEAPAFDQTLEISEQIEPQVRALLGGKTMTRFSSVWPDQKKRRANLEAWNRFWTKDRVQKLRAIFEREGSVYGFSSAAFEPFFKTLHLEPQETAAFEKIALLESMKRRFSFQGKSGYQLVSFFPDEEKEVRAVSRQAALSPGAFVVSAKRFEGLLSSATLREALFLSSAILLILPLLAFLFLKNIRLVGVALIPVVTSVLSALGTLSALKLNLNISSLVALMVMGGISIDYGLFMIHDYQHTLKTNTVLAVTLSALTTVLGAGALVFAKHPVLYTYGLTLVCGVTAGYVSAIFIVPAVLRLCGCVPKPAGQFQTA